MGVVFTLIFIPIILIAQVAIMLESCVHVLVLHSRLLNLVMVGFLLVNAGILAALLIARVQWKKNGRMERNYIRSYRGWGYLWRFCVKLLLILGPIWQVLILILCVLYLVTQPLQYLAPIV